MGTTYEYTYEYEVTDTNKHHRNVNDNQRTTGYHTNTGIAPAHTSRSSTMDALAALQHDRIWHKLYDPQELDRVNHEAEIQVCANRIQIFVKFS